MPCRCRCCSKIKVKNVLLDDGHAFSRKLRAEQGSEVAVQLDGNDMPCTFGESPRDGSLARTDFNYGQAGQIANGGVNPLNRGLVAKKVLAELGLLRH